MGYQDRDWYKDHHKRQERARRPATARWRFCLPSGATPTWKIVLFWVVVAVGLTFVFEPVAAKRAAKRVIDPAVKLFCSPGAKCT